VSPLLRIRSQIIMMNVRQVFPNKTVAIERQCLLEDQQEYRHY